MYRRTFGWSHMQGATSHHSITPFNSYYTYVIYINVLYSIISIQYSPTHKHIVFTQFYLSSDQKINIAKYLCQLQDPLAPNKKKRSCILDTNWTKPVRWLNFFPDQTIIRVTEYKIPKSQSYCWIQYERYQCIHHYLTLPHVTFSVPRLMNLSWWMDNLSSLTLHLSPQVIRIKGQDTGFKSALDIYML